MARGPDNAIYGMCYDAPSRTSTLHVCNRGDRLDEFSSYSRPACSSL